MKNHPQLKLNLGKAQVNLPHYLRALMLEEICRRMDIIAYLNETMDLGLIHDKGSYYKGKCPICRQKETFAISRKTGACTCWNCRKIADFPYVLSWSKNYDLNETLKFLSDYLEKAEDAYFASLEDITSVGGITTEGDSTSAGGGV